MDDDFGYEEEEIEKPKRSGGGVKFAILIFFIILGFAIGLGFGFFLGVVSLVNVIGDLTEGMNTTVTIDFDEEVAMNYVMKFMQEEYGDLIGAAALGKTPEVNMTDNEKIYAIIQGLDIEQIEQVIEIDDETRALLEEAKRHPEQRDISQTQQNFIPLELVDDIEEIQKQMKGFELAE